MLVGVLSACSLFYGSAAWAQRGIVLHSVSSEGTCLGLGIQDVPCEELLPANEIEEGTHQCVQVYVRDGAGARIAQLGLHLGAGWQFLGWSEGRVHAGTTLVNFVNGTVVICAALDSTLEQAMKWMGTAEFMAGPEGSALTLGQPALPGGATILTGEGEILPIEVTGDLALTAGGENVTGCGSGSRPGGPHPEELSINGEPAVEQAIGRIIPNPLRPGSKIEWSAGQNAIAIEVYDVAGRLVRVFQATGQAGLRATWDGRTSTGKEMQTGLHLLRIRQGESSLTRRVLFLR